MKVEELLTKAKQAGLKGTPFDSVGKAYVASLNSAETGDLVFVGGSTFVVAEII
jgi:dihydrofolate synthase / folylpolyglutamate synthase